MVHYGAFCSGEEGMLRWVAVRWARPGRGDASLSALPRGARRRLRPSRPIPAKVLRVAFPTAETGFDPVRVSDLYSNTINEAIFERLLTYDYLARPAKLVPMVAEAMPEVKDNGARLRVPLRKGIHFTPDPAFKGAAARARRARTSSTRSSGFVDPKNRSPWAFLLEGKIEGLDELADAAKKIGQVRLRREDRRACAAVDRYTLELPAEGDRLQLPLHRRPRAVRRGRARGDRGLRRRHRRRIRSAPARTC